MLTKLKNTFDNVLPWIVIPILFFWPAAGLWLGLSVNHELGDLLVISAIAVMVWVWSNDFYNTRTPKDQRGAKGASIIHGVMFVIVMAFNFRDVTNLTIVSIVLAVHILVALVVQLSDKRL